MSAVVKVERVQLPLPREATKAVPAIKISDQSGQKVVRLVEHQVGFAAADKLLGGNGKLYARANWDKNLRSWLVSNAVPRQEW